MLYLQLLSKIFIIILFWDATLNQPQFYSPPPLGELAAMYDDHLRLVGKHVVDLLLELIELFRSV